jgi:hypothetical protein
LRRRRRSLRSFRRPRSRGRGGLALAQVGLSSRLTVAADGVRWPSMLDKILSNPYKSRFYNLLNFFKGKQ